MILLAYQEQLFEQKGDYLLRRIVITKYYLIQFRTAVLGHDNLLQTWLKARQVFLTYTVSIFFHACLIVNFKAAKGL